MLTLIVLPFLLASSEAKALSFTNIDYEPVVDAYTLQEISFDIDQEFSNPYNPEQINIWATITKEGGKSISQPAFWWEEYLPNAEAGSYEATDEDGWKLRFTPRHTGTYTVQLHGIPNGGSTSSASSFSFTVMEGDDSSLRFLMAPGENHGFRIESDLELGVRLFGYNLPHRPNWETHGIVDRYAILLDGLADADWSNSSVRPYINVLDTSPYPQAIMLNSSPLPFQRSLLHL